MKIIKTSQIENDIAKLNKSAKDLALSIKNELGLQAFFVYVSDNRDLVIDSIIVPIGKRNQGIGSTAINRMLTFADKNRLRTVLSPGIKDPYAGTTSQNRLIRFYKQFGFVMNKGKNKDFSISKLMLRNPK